MRQISIIVLLFATFHNVFSTLSDSSTNIQLPFISLEQQCYYFEVEDLRSIIDIEVEDDKENGNLNVKLFDPDNNVLVEEVDTYSQHVRWPVSKSAYLEKIGVYHVCIENKISEATQVQLIIKITEKDNKYGIPRNVIRKIHKDKNYGAMENLMSLVTFDEITSHMLQMLEASQSDLSKVSFRLHTHIDEVNKVARRVAFFASAISGLVVLLAVIQIISIRSMFNETSKYGQFLRNGRTSNHYY